MESYWANVVFYTRHWLCNGRSSFLQVILPIWGQRVWGRWPWFIADGQRGRFGTWKGHFVVGTWECVGGRGDKSRVMFKQFLFTSSCSHILGSRQSVVFFSAVCLWILRGGYSLPFLKKDSSGKENRPFLLFCHLRTFHITTFCHEDLKAVQDPPPMASGEVSHLQEFLLSKPPAVCQGVVACLSKAGGILRQVKPGEPKRDLLPGVQGQGGTGAIWTFTGHGSDSISKVTWRVGAMSRWWYSEGKHTTNKRIVNWLLNRKINS